MTSSTIRKAIGAVKDKTSIRIAKVAGNISPHLEILMVKATSHDEDPSGEKYVREIVDLTSQSRGNAEACMAAISKRLGRTRDWMVALKAVMVVHRLLMPGGGPGFQEEILHAKRRGTRILNLWGFKDEAHSNSWDHCRFVRAYASYLDQKVDLIAYQRRLSIGLIGGSTATGTDDEYWCQYPPPLLISNSGNTKPASNEMRSRPERVLEKAIQLQRLLDRFLACRPTGEANNNKLVLIGVRLIVKESFELYADLREVLDVLLDRIGEMEYKERVMVFEVYVGASKQVVELEEFYGWCKDMGVFRSSFSDEYPRVRRITGILLETLEGSLKEKARKPNPNTSFEEEEIPYHQTQKSTLPPSPKPESTPKMMMMPQPPKEEAEAEDLVNLRDDDGATADDQSSQMALALFSEAPNNRAHSSWEAFPSTTNIGGEAEGASGWQVPAAEGCGKADWELDLVESASNLSKQKAALAGGFDQLLLNGIYDQGAVRQQASNVQLGDGSASSVALPGLGKGAVPVLALPAPDGAVVGQRDPFAASLMVPPPSYVQIADMERKQQLLVQEQQTWQHYGSNGMRGQVALGKIGGGFTPYRVAGPQAGVVPYGMMPSPAFGMEPHPGR